ncbi:MAG: Xaa-Pro peptidase family protein [Candidatus Jordarchaeaceae archaeon]
MKLEELRGMLGDVDALVLFKPENIFYFSGFFSTSFMYLLIPRNDTPIAVVSQLEFEAAKSTIKDFTILEAKKQEDFENIFSNFQRDLKIKKLGFEEDFLTVNIKEKLEKKSEGVDFVPASNVVKKLRAVKSQSEIEIIRKAVKIADEGVKRAIDVITPGIREYEVAAEAEYLMRKMGSYGTSFDTIIASGHRSAFPHATCSDRKLENGDLVVIDLGVRYKNYCSDISRTCTVGSPSSEQEKLFQTVLNAQQKAIRLIHPGVNASEIDEAAREVIRSAGYGDFFVHSFGHGIGIEVHEFPSISAGSKDVIEEGMVFTAEPGVYIPNFGGCRIEDMVLVRDDGYELLTHSPRYLNL